MPRWGAVGVGTSPILTDFFIEREKMKTITIILLASLAWGFAGYFLKDNKIIIQPPYWALYSSIYGHVMGLFIGLWGAK